MRMSQDAEERFVACIEAALCEGEGVQSGIAALYAREDVGRHLLRAVKAAYDDLERNCFFNSSSVKMMSELAADFDRAAEKEAWTIAIQDEYGIEPPQTERGYSDLGNQYLSIRNQLLSLVRSVNAVLNFIEARKIAAELLEECPD